VIASNPFLRSSILAGQTVKRLCREGASSEHAKRLVAQVINSEEAAIYSQHGAFDEVRMAERLNGLTVIG
jgi:hypothetical protein